MAPKIVDKDTRKKEIAHIALELFSDKGFEACSINDIAQASSIAKGTVYEYFDSKEELVFAALMAWVEGMEAELSSLRNTSSGPEEALIKLILGSVDIFINDPRSVKLMLSIFQLTLSGSPLLRNHDIIRETLQGFRRMVIELLLEGVSKGVFRPEIARDTEKIAINLMAYMDGIALHYFMSKNFFNIREQVEYYMRELLSDLKGDIT